MSDSEARLTKDAAAGLLVDFSDEILEGSEPTEEGGREASGEAEDQEEILEAAGAEDDYEDEDESEGESPEDESEDEESDEEPEEYDDEDEDESDDRDQTYTVRVAGEEVEVTWDELIAGYSRTADYTRKTQEIAEQRKAHEAELARVREERQEYGQRLEILKQTLEAAQPEEPTDPREWIEWKKGQERLEAVKAEQSKLHQKLHEEWLAEQDAVKQREAAILQEKIPEWADSQKAATEKKALVAFALGLGFTMEDLEGLTDHRAVMILRDAMRYHELQETRGKVRKKVAAAPANKPRPRKAKKSGRRKGIESRADRLSKSGRLDDAAGLLESIMLPEDL